MSTATLSRPDVSFTVEPKAFASAVAWAAKRVPSRPPTPTLGGILLVARSGRLAVSAFDYEVSATATLDLDSDTDLRVLVSGRLLDGLTKTLPNKPVEIGLADDRLTIRCGGVRLGLPSMDVESYPALPAMPMPAGTIDAVTFAHAVKRVALVAGESSAVPALTGVMLQFQPEHVTVMATDSYRAALAHVDWTPGGSVQFSVLVPAEALVKAVPAFAADGGALTVSADDNLFGLQGVGKGIVSHLLDPKGFPTANLPRALPPRSETPARVPVAEVSAAIKRAELVLPPKTVVSVTFESDTVTVHGAGEGDEVADETVACSYAGEPVTLRVKPQYLLDALHAAGSEAELSFTTPKRSFLVTSSDPADSYRHAIQPLIVK